MQLDAFSLQSDNAVDMPKKETKNEKNQKGGSSQRFEGHFKGFQGLELYLQSWQSSATPDPTKGKSTPRGTLVITHGMGEHSDCYHHTAEALVSMGWNVFSWDLRGHGRSEGKRGFIADFNHYALDLDFFLRHLKNTGKLDGPFALIGHSMGGLITLRHLLNEIKSESADGGKSPSPQVVTLSSPLLSVALAVPVIKDLAAKFLYKVIPSITLFNEIKYEDLTRDPQFLKGYATDTLRHDKISPGVYLGMLENMAMVKEQSALLQLPILVQAAGEDKIVSLPAIKEFFPLIGAKEKKLIVYEGNHHEIFNDLDRMQVYKDLDAFVGKVLCHE